MQFKCLVIDADGCVINNHEMNSIAHTRVTGRVPPGELRSKVIGKGVVEAWTIIKDYYGLNETVEELLEKRKKILSELLPKCPLVEGIVEIVDWCNNQQIPVIMTSSSSYIHLEQKLVGHRYIFPKFNHIICLEDDEPSKPNPALFLKAISKYPSFSPHDFLIIEDSDLGEQAALSLGCQIKKISPKQSSILDLIH